MRNLINMMEQVKKLKNGIGIKNLLDEAHKILKNPIVMFNTEYELLAYTETVTDDPIWNEIITYKTFCKETQEFFKKEGFIEDVANAQRITFMSSDKLKYDRITGKVFSKNNSHVANLVIVACNKPFEANDRVVFEAICKLVTREIDENEFYQEYEQTHQEGIIKNLIDGNFDRELDMGQVAIIYDNLKSNLYLSTVDVSQGNFGYPELVYFRDLFKQIQPAHKYAIYANYILIIISTDDETLNIGRELNKLLEIFEQNNMYAGISGRFENLFELGKYYADALKAVQFLLESKSSQRIFPYDINAINTMKQIAAIENGMGVQYLLNMAYKIFGNPMLIHDIDFEVVAYIENVKSDDPVWKEYITYGTLSDETIEFFKNEGFIDAVLNANTCTFLDSPKLKHRRIMGKIYNKDNIMVACLRIVDCNKAFEDDELALVGAFCTKLSIELSKSEFYNNYGQAFSETLISRLINGNINDCVLFSDHITNIYNIFEDSLYLAVVDTTRCAPEHTRLSYYRDLFKQLQITSRYAIYDNYIIIIFGSDIGSGIVKNELKKVFEQNNIYAEISSSFKSIYELQKHYTEAVNALNSSYTDSV